MTVRDVYAVAVLRRMYEYDDQFDILHFLGLSATRAVLIMETFPETASVSKKDY